MSGNMKTNGKGVFPRENSNHLSQHKVNTQDILWTDKLRNF